jgi:hypothetical protein
MPLQRSVAGLQQAGEAAEAVQQLLRQLQHALPAMPVRSSRASSSASASAAGRAPAASRAGVVGGQVLDSWHAGQGASVESGPVYCPRAAFWAFRSPVETHLRSPTDREPIQPGSFLTLHYRLRGPDGADVVNTFADKPATLSLGTGPAGAGHRARLLGLPEGAHERFELPPARPSASATPSCCSG